MKKLLCIYCLIFAIADSALGQNIAEKKVIYNVPGKDNKLINSYGVVSLIDDRDKLNLLGGKVDPKTDREYSSVVEVIDLAEKGFIYRDHYKILLFDNQLKKIAEHDLEKNFIDINLKRLRFLPVSTGVIIYQDFIVSPKPTEVKFASLSYNGDLKIKEIKFPEKYDMCLFDNSNRDLLVFRFKFYKKDPFSTMSLNTETLEYTAATTYKPESPTKDGFFWVGEFRGINKDYYVWFNTTAPNGSTIVEVDSRISGQIKSSKKIEINVKELKGMKQEDLSELKERVSLYVDENKNDFYIFFNMVGNGFSFQNFLIVKGTFNSESFFVKQYSKEELKALNIPSKYFADYSLTDGYVATDTWIYPQHNYLSLNFHARGMYTAAGGMSTERIKYLFLVTVNDKAEIVKSEFCTYEPNLIRHNVLALIPKKSEILYIKEGYKKQELDLIHELKTIPEHKNDLFAILLRDGYTYILRIREKDSEVEVWKSVF